MFYLSQNGIVLAVELKELLLLPDERFGLT